MKRCRRREASAVALHVVRARNSDRSENDDGRDRLQSAAPQDHVVRQSRSRGRCEALLGGDVPKDSALAGGFFANPAIFGDVAPDSRLAREEVFGPILPVIRWTDEDAMFDEVNAVEYGLTGAVHARIWRRRTELLGAWNPATCGSTVRPRTFTRVKRDMAVFREEIFGPVLCAMSFSDDDLDRAR